MQIQVLDYLSPQQWDYLTDNNDLAFPEEGHDMQWDDSNWFVVALNKDNLPISNIGFNGFNLEIYQQRFHVVGVGGVITKQAYRGQGLVPTLFETLHSSEVALGISTTFALFCPLRLVSYYQRAGYKVHNHPVTFRQDNKMSSSTDFAFMLYGDALPEGPVIINGLPW